MKGLSVGRLAKPSWPNLCQYDLVHSLERVKILEAEKEYDEKTSLSKAVQVEPQGNTAS